MAFQIISILVLGGTKVLILRDAKHRFGSWNAVVHVYRAALRSGFSAGLPPGAGWWPRTVAGARPAVYMLAFVLMCVLGLTGFLQVIFTGGHPSGVLLLIHMIAAPLFALTLAVASLLWSHDQQLRESDLPLLGQVVRTGTFVADTARPAVARALYWLILLLALPLLLSIILSLFPLFGTGGEECLIGLHGYSAVALVAVALLHGYICLIRSLSGTHQG
jgi:hypothetical protein